MRGVRDPKLALVVPRSRGQLCVREELATMSGNQSGGFCLTLGFWCVISLPLISALVLCLSIGESLRRGLLPLLFLLMWWSLRGRLVGRGCSLRRTFQLVIPSFSLTMVPRFFQLLDCFTRVRHQLSRQKLKRRRSRVIAYWRKLRRPLLALNVIMVSSLKMIHS